MLRSDWLAIITKTNHNHSISHKGSVHSDGSTAGHIIMITLHHFGLVID